MQRTLRLALAQFNPTVGDIAGNTVSIIEEALSLVLELTSMIA